MTMSDFILIDTNVLIYADQSQDQYHIAAKTLRDRAARGEFPACISPQILSEFFSTITNSRRVSLPRTPEAAMQEIEEYSKLFYLIYPGVGIVERMKTLFDVHAVEAQGIYDLFLVATMLENDVTKIYTYNTKDFTPFSDMIEVLTPPIPTEVSPQ